MRICGIIAEYDPFHNGHLWQLEQARLKSQADQIVCIISTCFTQRGMPALFSPQLRAEAALRAGADLVLGLPVSYSVCTADRFALGGVHILKKLGANALSFGVEPEGMDVFERAAAVLSAPDEGFRSRLARHLQQGLPFPLAQGLALSEILGVSPDILALPNTALAISYCKANIQLNAGLEIFPVPRSGSYHDESLPEDGLSPSATAVRNAVLQGNMPAIQKAVPAFSAALIEKAVQSNDLHLPEALTPLLRWKLRTTAPNDIAALPDLSEGLENRFSAAADCGTRDEMVLAIKSKRYPYSRINRLLTHLLLGTDASKLSALPEHAHILAFRNNASCILKTAKDNGFPLYPHIPPKPSTYELSLDAHADDLWHLGANESFGAAYRTHPFILK